MGAYLGLVTPGVPILGAFMFNVDLQVPGATSSPAPNVFTNKTWTDAYRGAGRPEATFAIERMMDELAVELGRDPLEVREQNWIKHEEFPFTTVAGLDVRLRQLRGGHRQGEGAVRLRRAAAPSRPSAASASDPVQLGIGISTFTEMCGLAPSRVLGALRLRRRRLGDRVDPDAADRQGRGRHRLERRTARATRRRGARSSPTSSGVPFEDVEVLHGDTQISPEGLDTYGSRSLVVGGIAVVKAAEKVIEKAKVIAAHMLEANAGRPRVRATAGSASRAPTRASGIADIAFAVFAAHNLPDGVEPTLDSDGHLRPGELLLPARHAPVRHRGRHRDRRGDASAPTSASTTSARWSTR